MTSTAIPQNIVPFVLRGLSPLNKLDQSIMRKLADLTGWTVEDLIHEGILQFIDHMIGMRMRRAFLACRIGASISINAVDFSSARTTKRFPSWCVCKNRCDAPKSN